MQSDEIISNVTISVDENTRNKFLFFGDIEHGLDHFIPSMPSDFLATSDKVSLMALHLSERFLVGEFRGNILDEVS